MALPPLAWTRLRAVFQAFAALARTVSKPAASAVALFCAPATLTNEIPTVALTTAFEVVSKVTYAPVWVPLALVEPFAMVPPLNVPTDVGVRSNRIE